MLGKLLSKIENKIYAKMGIAPDRYKAVWIRGVKDDFKNNKTTTLRQKLWAYKRGLLSYYINHLGLTEENYDDIISYRDYAFLYPLNNKYSSWISNKLSFRYVLEPFKEYLPKYYYHILQNRKCKIISLMDLPAGYGASFEEVVRLLKDEGALAVKMISSSAGIGFYKFSYNDGKYYINEAQETTPEKLIALMKGFDEYLITQYVRQHSEISKIYGGSLNTVRMMVANEYGDGAKILEAFYRIGTKKSGVNDDVGGGAIYAHIDMETGRLDHGYKAKSRFEYIPCERHPDSGVKLDTVIIPRWDFVKRKVVEIANYIPQLEWMGFDVGITEDGFEVHEINEMPLFSLSYKDMDSEITAYLKRKLVEKKTFLKNRKNK